MVTVGTTAIMYWLEDWDLQDRYLQDQDQEQEEEQQEEDPVDKWRMRRFGRWRLRSRL